MNEGAFIAAMKSPARKFEEQCQRKAPGDKHELMKTILWHMYREATVGSVTLQASFFSRTDPSSTARLLTCRVPSGVTHPKHLAQQLRHGSRDFVLLTDVHEFENMYKKVDSDNVERYKAKYRGKGAA